jgi:hypothetical protein
MATIPTTQPCLYFTTFLPIGAPPATVVPFHRCLTSIVPPHNNTHGDELADPLSHSEQFITHGCRDYNIDMGAKIDLLSKVVKIRKIN